MFTNTLSPNTLRGLKLIGKEKWLDFAYLAGGTALALRLGHRQSVDLDFLSQKFNFPEMFEFYDRKYHCLESHKYNILKSLNYFEDAESEDSPRMFKPTNWPKIKVFFQKEVKKLSVNLI